MNTTRWSLLTAMLLVSNVITIILLVAGDRERDTALARVDLSDCPQFQKLESSVAELAKLLRARPALPSDSALPPRPSPPTPNLADHPSLDRLEVIANSLRELQAVVGRLENHLAAPSEELDFAADNGFVHADGLFDKKRYAEAASGYLKFLEAHNDHPDYRDIAGKARDALVRAGYRQQAIDLQKEQVERFPEHRDENLATLSRLEKDSGNLDDAITHLSEAIDLTANKEERLWRMMYRAWYRQLRDGDAAGIKAYREVDALRRSFGVDNEKMEKKLANYIAEAQRRLEAE